MRKKIKQNLNVIWLAIVSFTYALGLIFQTTYIRIIEPPGRYLLILLLLALPVLIIFSLLWEWADFEGWLLVLLAMAWAFVTWFYFAHTVDNSGWIMSGAIAGFAFVSLYRGDYH